MAKKTIQITRDGVTRRVSEREMLVVDYASQGWKRVEPSDEAGKALELKQKEKEEQDKAEAEAKQKAAEAEAAAAKAKQQEEEAAEEAAIKAAEAAATNDNQFSIEGKTSKDFGTKDLASIKAALQGASAETIEAFFATEDRQTMMLAKIELVEASEKANQ